MKVLPIFSRSLYDDPEIAWGSLPAGGMAQLPWLWEYKRKQRTILKKEREKEKKEEFPEL